MNVSVTERIRQVELNLERWRWLPQQLGERYIVVNTAAFYLKVMEHGRKKMEMRVVVGRPARQSPVFSAEMTYIVLNPYWNVPHKLAVEDILPKAKKDVGYLIDKNFKVFRGWKGDAEELDPQTIQWEAYSKHRFPFRLRQEPGEKNALGRIKFMFPNQFAVYLHDTPQKSYFARAQRDFSSGCIRLEDARALAGYLLADTPNWLPETLNKNLEQKVDERTREIVVKNRALSRLNKELESGLYNTVRSFAALSEMHVPMLAGHGRRSRPAYPPRRSHRRRLSPRARRGPAPPPCSAS